ncbi:MAG: serine/threonine-protein phosphatase [Firmicutes bacterium]|nr:serine/threonine-protein phosphatase [Bacillota bacterium]
MRAWAASDSGLVRARNEDAYLVLDLADGLACAVADGLGGMQAGEVAAALAMEVVREHLAGLRAGAGRAVLRDAIWAAHRRILEVGRARRELMASTLTLAVLSPGTVSIGHVGDSRAYLFRPDRAAPSPAGSTPSAAPAGGGSTGTRSDACVGKEGGVRPGTIRQLTRDHSRVGELLWRGALTEAQARRHPQRHLLDQALGAGDLIEVDLIEVELQPGDILLLCTDGLSGVVDSSEMAGILAAGDLPLAPARLVELANARGGPDNITVVVAEASWEDDR